MPPMRQEIREQLAARAFPAQPELTERNARVPAAPFAADANRKGPP